MTNIGAVELPPSNAVARTPGLLQLLRQLVLPCARWPRTDSTLGGRKSSNVPADCSGASRGKFIVSLLGSCRLFFTRSGQSPTGP
jgi:hypothetical protein